ncbi:hypothetical protein [Fluviicola taffensis]|uniref:KWG Leptospira repeat protein n=1 Tax=Fluviicola taffensis (strain DSM 16823 / NCIMB 13979 / RW262) TaxID=755732 RepID=F2IAS7_FLUTR|nr:hypothetical protein [Fluviicola taffensis]AEA44232.1 hypothetical protein Fluta_2246 [Fluviicola taffensis DSM 16823]
MRFFYLFLFLHPLVLLSQAPIPRPDCDNSPYIIVNNYSDTTIHFGQYLFGLNDRNGNVILPIQYNQLFPIRIVNDSCGRMTSKFIVTNGNFQYVYDAITKEESEKHQHIFYLENYFLFKDSLYWGVIDSSLNTILRNIPGEPGTTTIPESLYSFNLDKSYSPFDLFYEDLFEYRRYLEEGNSLEKWPSVLLYKKDCTKKFASPLDVTYSDLPWNHKIPSSMNKYGLFDLQSKKLIPAIYHEISFKTLDKKIYYWCAIFKQYNTPITNWSYQGELHIYDQSLNLIKKLPFHTNPPVKYDYNNDYHPYKTKRDIYPLENLRNKYGAIDAKGITVLSFEYDNISPPVNYSYYSPYLKAVKKNSVQLLDTEGKQIIDGSYLDINVLSKDQPYFAAKTDTALNSWHLISKEGKILTSGFEQLFYNKDLIYHLDIPYEYRRNDQPIFCAIGNSKMYLISNNTSYLCDSTRFNFKQETFYMNQFIVNKTGDLIYHGNFLVMINKLGYVDINSGCTTIISIDGKQKQEIDLPFSEIDWLNNLVCLKTEDNQFVTFDLRNWKWLKD